jgi:catechol 2,3-dioxygenase-like lactoylglutathione lyase family enzyme
MTDQAYNIPPLSMVMFGVTNLDRALSFYQGRLGIKVRQRFEGFSFLDTGTVTVVLSESLARNISPIAGATEAVFSVDDVRAHHQALQKQGVDFTQEPRQVSGPMWAANFLDPDGHLLSIFGPERKS